MKLLTLCVISLFIASILCQGQQFDNPCKILSNNQDVCQEAGCLFDQHSGLCIQLKDKQVHITQELKQRYKAGCESYNLQFDKCQENDCLFDWNSGQCKKDPSKAQQIDEQQDAQQTQLCQQYNQVADLCGKVNGCVYSEQISACITQTMKQKMEDEEQQRVEEEAQEKLQASKNPASLKDLLAKKQEKDMVQLEQQCNSYHGQQYWCEFFKCIYNDSNGDCQLKRGGSTNSNNKPEESSQKLIIYEDDQPTTNLLTAQVSDLSNQQNIDSNKNQKINLSKNSEPPQQEDSKQNGPANKKIDSKGSTNTNSNNNNNKATQNANDNSNNNVAANQNQNKPSTLQQIKSKGVMDDDLNNEDNNDIIFSPPNSQQPNDAQQVAPGPPSHEQCIKITSNPYDCINAGCQYNQNRKDQCDLVDLSQMKID